MSRREVSVGLQPRVDGDYSPRGKAQSLHQVRNLDDARKRTKSTSIHFAFVYYLALFLTVLDFFLTNHPYLALHNYGDGDQFFFLNINMPKLIGISILINMLILRAYIFDARILALCLLCVISGVLTQRIESKFLTYGLLVVTLLGTSSMGRHDVLLNSERSGIVRSLSMVSVVVWILGLATVILLPETSGFFHFAFSRELRSEITLWYMTGLYAVFPCLCVVNIIKNSRISQVFWSFTFIAHLILTGMTARRTWLIQATIPVVLGVAFSRLSWRKLAAIAVLGVGFLGALYNGLFNKLIEIFFLSTSASQISIEDASNGRASLWEYHLECFLRSPIWGNGVYMVDYNRDKESLTFLKAESEIGVMSVFSEFGAMVGLAMVTISVVAFVRSFGFVKSALVSKDNAFSSFLALYYVTNYALFLVENNSSICNLESFVFWYAMMFFFYKKRK